MENYTQFPPQLLPYKKKGKKWRKQVLDWADKNGSYNYSPVRNSVKHKKINYDLLGGKLHMQDLQLIVNPDELQAGFIPKKIQHYPIMNSKLNVLRGEESKRVFDFKVVVTNPNAITEIENNKKQELFQRLQAVIENTAISEEQLKEELQKIQKYFTYEWQDAREIRANQLTGHYRKELNFDSIFNDGFMDAQAVGEEIYQCDIVGGEPTLIRLNPMKVRVFRSGYENKIENADMIILEDYWSPGKIIDTYYDVLTEKDIKSIMQQSNPASSNSDEDREDPRDYFVHKSFVAEDGSLDSYSSLFSSDDDITALSPYDMHGNVRVLRVYWKSARKIKKVKSYNPQTGEAEYNLYPETYIINEDLGEEEEVFYINQAWEGTKIGKDIYVNMRPRPIQYNRMSCPSRCHFGIVGTIYNLNDDKPYSMVDMMKPYNYYYDVIHDRLNKLISRNLGKLVPLDLAKVPKGWDVEKWIYFARVNGLIVVDSFKEGNYGAAAGKVAGALNNNMSVVDAELGNSIQQNIQLLEFLKSEMSDVVGISRQREGQISNRETVGGVERATLQSSHITEWYFTKHEDTKKRVYECFLETAKIALKGNTKKFQYILSDFTQKIVEIDGDQFAECDYGLVVDNSAGVQELSQKLDMLAQAALQNQTLSFSSIMKLYTTGSLAEKQRMIEADEQAIIQRNQEAQQQQLQAQQEQMQMQMQTEQAKMQQEDMLNQRDNETKIIIATLNAEAKQMPEDDGIMEMTEEQREKFKESVRQFNAKLDLEKERLDFDKSKAKTDADLKRMQINKSKTTNK